MPIEPKDGPLTSRAFPIGAKACGLVLLLSLGALFLRHGEPVVQADHPSPDGVAQAPQATGLIITEFRLRGTGGPTDEFIEVFNNSGVDHTVTASSGAGYAIVASDGIVRCVIPNNTIIPSRAHYLCVNSSGYSLANYPGGNSSTGTGNSTFSLDVPDNAGIALFNSNFAAGFTLANRFDAVGSTAETNALYKNGTGYPVLAAFSSDFSWFRRSDLVTGLPINTNDNALDFQLADTNGTTFGPPPRLGAPGPQNLSSPIFGTGAFAPLLLDSTRAFSTPPNRVRDTTPDIPNNSAFGTVSIRRRFVNQTGVNITRLRFRILDLSTFAESGVADLRPRTSTAVVVAGINDPATCFGTPPCTVTVQGTFLEAPPSQPNGGGFNSSLSDGTVTLATPIANGNSVFVQFLFGVQAKGNYRMVIELEALPGASAVFRASGNTEVLGATSDALNTVADFDGDGKTDLSVFRPADGVWYLLRSQAGFSAMPFGLSTDRIVPADFDGDGTTDIAVYRPSTGFWYVLNSGDNSLFVSQFGIAEDLPAPADYDGDGKADLCVFRPSTGSWYRINSSNGAFIPQQFGASGDKPTVGDFDGDAKADLAVYRPSASAWYRLNSSNGAFIPVAFGLSTDVTAPGDFDGDGKIDICVFRPSTGAWYRLNSSNGAFIATQFGVTGDIPTPGDYDLDGREDISVFRPVGGSWYRLNSSNGAFVGQAFGTNGDRPTPAAFQY